MATAGRRSSPFPPCTGRRGSSATRCAKCARTDGAALEMSKAGFAASFILGGQIGAERPRLFQIYAEGNFIEATDDTPFLQIGEHKYGKPILDRVARPEMRLGEGAKLILLSFDSTLRSNLSVGMPLDHSDLRARQPRCEAARSASTRTTSTSRSSRPPGRMRSERHSPTSMNSRFRRITRGTMSRLPACHQTDVTAGFVAPSRGARLARLLLPPLPYARWARPQGYKGELRVNICMIGAGYVGLVSAACFSEFGWTVTCVDKDPQRLKELNSGISPIYEPGLEDLMERNMKAGRLRFTDELGPAVRDADIVFLAVGTPMRRGDGHADLSYVFAAVADLAPHLDGFTVITTKSTVPVGTSREIEKRLKELAPERRLRRVLQSGVPARGLGHPGLHASRPHSRRHRQRAGRGGDGPLYKPLALRNSPVMFVSRESAELAKYAANAFLALKISFINEIADVCEQVGANVQEVASAIGKDRRIGDKFPASRPGLRRLVLPEGRFCDHSHVARAKVPVSIIEQVSRVNDERKIAMGGRIEEAAGGSVRDKTDRRARRHVQAEHRRHARCAEPRHPCRCCWSAGATVRVFDPQGPQAC